MDDRTPERPVGNRRGRETRHRILAAAADEFRDRGMDLTLDDVATTAGTTRMTVHRHTGGREALITHLVLRESAALAGSLSAVLDREGPFDRRLVDALVLTVTSIRSADHLHRLFTDRVAESALSEVDPDQRVLSAINSFFRPYFEDAGRRGLLRAGVDDTVMWVLNQLLVFLMVPGTAHDEAAVKTQLETFVVPAVLVG